MRKKARPIPQEIGRNTGRGQAAKAAGNPVNKNPGVVRSLEVHIVKYPKVDSLKQNRFSPALSNQGEQSCSHNNSLAEQTVIWQL